MASPEPLNPSGGPFLLPSPPDASYENKKPGGGVSVHFKPSASSNQSSEEQVKSPASISEEESKLLSDSNSFAANAGPQPSIPQSVPAMSYRYGSGAPAQATGAQPMSRYRESFSSNTSSAFTSNPAFPSGDARIAGEDDSIHMCRLISHRITACNTWIGRTPGMPVDRSNRHREMLNEIGQLVNSTVHRLRMERDQGIVDYKKQHDNYTRAVRDKTAATNKVEKLQRELGQALSKEDALTQELKILRGRIDKLEAENGNYQTKLKTVQDHYSMMIDKWSALEEKQGNVLQGYKDQVKDLQSRNSQLIKAAKGKSAQNSPMPAEAKPSSAPEGDHKKGLDDETYAELHKMLIKKHGPQTDDNDAAGSSGFKPNPKAPSWDPQNQVKRSHSFLTVPSATSATARRDSPVGGPSNWPALINNDSSRRGSSENASQKQLVRASSAVNKAPGPSFPRHKEEWTMADIQNGIDHIFGLTKGYIVRCHSKQGEQYKVADLMLEKREPTTWNYLLSLVYSNRSQARNHMLYLLGVPSYRPYIIMRVALDYLFKKVISPDIFLGIDRNLDSHLTALQEKITTFHRAGGRTNPRDRQRVIEEHARIVAHALKSSNIELFKKESIERHAHMMAIIMQPLRSISVTDKDAIKPLRVMVSATWEVSAKVWMSGMTLHYTFPECACKFAEGTMEPVNGGALGLSPSELQMTHTRVSFVVSPVLSVRDERDENELEYHGIKKAQVLVMK
ncbi:hypothetical protein F4774DRAFT_429419 [Daldinia eschscholtzii]|nr:hypothetical protein F4774DRAFT_429419 [Daldinia eschscholtzii]